MATLDPEMHLPWPDELAAPAPEGAPRWHHAGSNLVLDFHGDPGAPLAVFSDGNHHMALQACLADFCARTGLEDIFYATTPPAPLMRALASGRLYLGNLCLRVRPQVFIGPEDLLARLAADGRVDPPRPFMRSRGNVLAVRAGNPRGITGIDDLLRDDLRLFISNPETEAASHRVYRDTARDLAAAAGLDGEALGRRLTEGGAGVVFGRRIHHRELPQAIAEGRADVAVCYYHLALRYRRIFPEHLDFVPLGGSQADPRPAPGNQITRYHLATVGGGGTWGPRLRDYLLSEAATAHYHAHGLARPDEDAPPPVAL